ncbi:MAG: hypothetical protein ABIJ97_15030 [Bacteroidota bacterium]
MRIIFVLLFILFYISHCMFGQECIAEKNTYFASGTAGFASLGGDLYEDLAHNKQSMFSLGLSINRFIGNNIFAGGILSVTRAKQGDVEINSVSVGPQFGVAIGRLVCNIPYIFWGAQYCNITTEDTGYLNDVIIEGVDYNFGLGIIIPLKRNLGFQIEGQYHYIGLTNHRIHQGATGDAIIIGVGIVGLFN